MTVTTTMEVSTPQSVNREIYADQQAMKILQFLLKSPRTILAPETTPSDETDYPQVGSILSGAAGAADLLKRMAAANVLIADLVDKAPQCPECGSRQISIRYLCPKCSSYNIERSYLYEHLKCGKVASDDTFRKDEQIVCPKCQAILHNFGIEYRVVGAWYKCNSCSESFNVPSHSHFCRTKHHQFTPERTRLQPIFQYRLNMKALSEIRKGALNYSDALVALENLGLTIQAPHTLTGKSGEPQTFDIVATIKGRWGGSKTIAIDVISSDTAVSAEEIRNFATKVRQARPSESYLITVPGLNDETRAVARTLKVNYIEGATVKEATTTLLKLGSFKEHNGY
jgi:transposase-like protein